MDEEHGTLVIVPEMDLSMCTIVTWVPGGQGSGTESVQLLYGPHVITDSGGRQQTIHPNLSQPVVLRYIIFVAFQDVAVKMGPTCFLLGTHMEEIKDLLNCGDMMQKDQVITNSNSQLSTLKRGDCAPFYVLMLHCRNANESTKTRELFNLCFHIS